MTVPKGSSHVGRLTGSTAGERVICFFWGRGSPAPWPQFIGVNLEKVTVVMRKPEELC